MVELRFQKMDNRKNQNTQYDLNNIICKIKDAQPTLILLMWHFYENQLDDNLWFS